MLTTLARSTTPERMLKSKNMNFAVLAFNCIIAQCPRLHSQDETFMVYKAYYTRQLKQLIIDYEPKSES